MLIDTGWHLLSFFTEGKDVPLQQILPFVCFGFSYVIPFLKINLPAVSQKENQLVFDEMQTQQLIQNTNQTSQFDWLNLILSTFVLVSIFMIIKSIVSIKKITNLKGTEIIYQKQKVKLIDKQLPPFSFWNKIYLNKSYFQN